MTERHSSADYPDTTESVTVFRTDPWSGPSAFGDLVARLGLADMCHR